MFILFTTHSTNSNYGVKDKKCFKITIKSKLFIKKIILKIIIKGKMGISKCGHKREYHLYILLQMFCFVNYYK